VLGLQHANSSQLTLQMNY